MCRASPVNPEWSVLSIPIRPIGAACSTLTAAMSSKSKVSNTYLCLSQYDSGVGKRGKQSQCCMRLTHYVHLEQLHQQLLVGT